LSVAGALAIAPAPARAQAFTSRIANFGPVVCNGPIVGPNGESVQLCTQLSSGFFAGLGWQFLYQYNVSVNPGSCPVNGFDVFTVGGAVNAAGGPNVPGGGILAATGQAPWAALGGSCRVASSAVRDSGGCGPGNVLIPSTPGQFPPFNTVRTLFTTYSYASNPTQYAFGTPAGNLNQAINLDTTVGPGGAGVVPAGQNVAGLAWGFTYWSDGNNGDGLARFYALGAPAPVCPPAVAPPPCPAPAANSLLAGQSMTFDFFSPVAPSPAGAFPDPQNETAVYVSFDDNAGDVTPGVLDSDTFVVPTAVMGSLESAGTASCNGTQDDAGAGLVYQNSSLGFGSWQDVLALLYGGQDNSTGTVDCNSAKRRALVSSWSNLFQTGCTNPVGACNAAPVNGALWHAYRPDDSSDVADVFAAAIGLSPSPTVSANNGFGASPYCNAINWDTSTANANCSLGPNKQWTGPGGVLDPVANDGVHRRPPPGTWGDNPDPSQAPLGADVLSTSMQDNDPIRRPCIGGATDDPVRQGEEVCNLDGALGLVLPISDTSFIAPPLVQYARNNCNTFAFGKPPVVFTCAVRGYGTRHSGECPNGDALIAGGCLVPIDSVNNTSQCVATRATVAALQSRALGNPDGRVYNIQMRDGTVTEPTIGYVQLPVQLPPLGGTSQMISLDFVGGYGRIHQVETFPSNLGGCRNPAADVQLGCLVHADRCSIALSDYAGEAPDNTDLRINQVCPDGGVCQ
jgi:hypothetical protein